MRRGLLFRLPHEQSHLESVHELVFSRLRQMGVDIDPSVYTIEQAKAAVLAKLNQRKGAV